MARSTSTALVLVKPTMAVITSVRSWRWLIAAVCTVGLAACAPSWKNTDGHYTWQPPVGIR